MFRIHAPLAAAALLLVGCVSQLGAAVNAFEAGRLPEAAAELRALEPKVAALGERDRTRYALVFGLTELALGDLNAAERWLLPLKAAVETDPHRLSDAERGALFAALRSTGRMPGE